MLFCLLWRILMLSLEYEGMNEVMKRGSTVGCNWHVCRTSATVDSLWIRYWAFGRDLYQRYWLACWSRIYGAELAKKKAQPAMKRKELSLSFKINSSLIEFPVLFWSVLGTFLKVLWTVERRLWKGCNGWTEPGDSLLGKLRKIWNVRRKFLERRDLAHGCAAVNIYAKCKIPSCWLPWKGDHNL